MDADDEDSRGSFLQRHLHAASLELVRHRQVGAEDNRERVVVAGETKLALDVDARWKVTRRLHDPSPEQHKITIGLRNRCGRRSGEGFENRPQRRIDRVVIKGIAEQRLGACRREGQEQPRQENCQTPIHRVNKPTDVR